MATSMLIEQPKVKNTSKQTEQQKVQAQADAKKAAEAQAYQNQVAQVQAQKNLQQQYVNANTSTASSTTPSTAWTEKASGNTANTTYSSATDRQNAWNSTLAGNLVGGSDLGRAAGQSDAGNTYYNVTTVNGTNQLAGYDKAGMLHVVNAKKGTAGLDEVLNYYNGQGNNAVYSWGGNDYVIQSPVVSNPEGGEAVKTEETKEEPKEEPTAKSVSQNYSAKNNYLDLYNKYADMREKQKQEYADELRSATDIQKEQLQREYNENANDLYRLYRTNQNKLPETLSNRGMTGGASESANLALMNNYASNLNASEQNRLKANAELETAYYNKVAENSLNIANQLASAYLSLGTGYVNRMETLEDKYDQRDYEAQAASTQRQQQLEDMALQRQWQLEDEERQRGYQLQDSDTEYQRTLEQMRINQGYNVDNMNLEYQLGEQSADSALNRTMVLNKYNSGLSMTEADHDLLNQQNLLTFQSTLNLKEYGEKAAIDLANNKDMAEFTAKLEANAEADATKALNKYVKETLDDAVEACKTSTKKNGTYGYVCLDPTTGTWNYVRDKGTAQAYADAGGQAVQYYKGKATGKTLMTSEYKLDVSQLNKSGSGGGSGSSGGSRSSGGPRRSSSDGGGDLDYNPSDAPQEDKEEQTDSGILPVDSAERKTDAYLGASRNVASMMQTYTRSGSYDGATNDSAMYNKIKKYLKKTGLSLEQQYTLLYEYTSIMGKE